MVSHKSPTPWYFDNLDDNWVSVLTLTITTFLILLSALVPISLTVQVDLIKVMHKIYIDSVCAFRLLYAEDSWLCHPRPRVQSESR